MHFTAPPKFKILVAGIVQPSDPSRGINAVKARSGFELQIVNCPDGTSRIGGPTSVVPPPTLAAHTVAIQVAAPNYWDPTAVFPPPFYWKDEAQAGDVYLVASDNFGAGEGSGAGPVSTIANELASSLNLVPGVSAASDGVDTVYVTSSRPEQTFPIKASNDFSVVFGGSSFVISTGGTVLNGGAECHQTYYVLKSTKTQTPPVILP